MYSLGAPQTPVTLAGVLVAIAALVFLSLFGAIVLPLLEPLLWAMVAAMVTWPIRRWLTRRFSLGAGKTALLMTIVLIVALIVAVVPLSLEFAHEVSEVMANKDHLFRDLALRAQQIPALGQRIPAILSLLERGESGAILGQLLQAKGQVLAILAGTARGVLRAVFIMSVAVFISYFLYRDGPDIACQIKIALLRIGGKRALRLLRTAERTIRGGFYGTLVTALVQGGLSGIGFYFAGVAMPVLLGGMTTIFSFIPFGGPLIYLPVAAYVAFVTGPWYAGAGLAVWGLLVVGTADNVIRPLFIAHSTKLSVLLVFFGVLGGVLTFGLIGVILGPAVMAVGRSLWIEFTAPRARIRPIS